MAVYRGVFRLYRWCSPSAYFNANESENSSSITITCDNNANNGNTEQELDSNAIIDQLCNTITDALHDAQIFQGKGKEEENPNNEQTLEYLPTTAINLILSEEITNTILPLTIENHYKLIQALKPFFNSVDSKNFELQTISDGIDPTVDPTIRNLFENHENFNDLEDFNTKFQTIITARDQLFLTHGVDPKDTDINPWEELFDNFINTHCLCVPYNIPTVSYFGLSVKENQTLLAQTDVVGFEQFMRSIYKSVNSIGRDLFEEKFSFDALRGARKSLFPVTISQFLDTVLRLSEEFGHPFPFKQIDIKSKKGQDINLNENWGKLIDFLKTNSQLTYLRLYAYAEIDEKNSQLFLNALAENNITCTIVLISNDSLPKQVENQILYNKRQNHQNNPHETITTTSQKKLSRLHIPPSWNKPRLTSTHNTNLDTQYEHAMQHVVNTESLSEQEKFDAIIDERINNIDNEQKQELDITSNQKPRLSQLINRDNIQEFCSGIHTFINDDDLPIIWDNVVGKKSQCVNKITFEAMNKILTYRDSFESGLMLSNLPAGFYLAKSNAGRNVGAGAGDVILG